jgi:hypothetical protein
MPTRKTIVCLANSKKLGAYCVAGVEQDTQDWIRPLGSGSHGAVTVSEQTLADGTRPELLDLIEVPLERPAPQPGQPENWELASGRWRRLGQLDNDDARDLLESLAEDAPAFGTNERSVSVADVAAGEVACSLAVVRPERLRWTKRVWPEGTKIRAVFMHAGGRHDLPVTDPAWLAHFAHDAPGDYGHVDSEEVYLVLSLGEPMNDEHWKLVAGVICLSV